MFWLADGGDHDDGCGRGGGGGKTKPTRVIDSGRQALNPLNQRAYMS